MSVQKCPIRHRLLAVRLVVRLTRGMFGTGLVETLGRLSAIGGLGDHPAIGIAFAPDVVEPEHLLLALNRPLVWTVTCSRQPLANPPVGDEVAAAGAWYDPVILGS